MTDPASEVPEAIPFSPPLNRMVVAILSLLGLMIALYMLAYAMGLTGPVICGIGDCERVQSSPYSRIGPVPIAAFGVIGYLGLIFTSFLGLRPSSRGSRLIPAILLGGGFAGLVFTGYLTYLEAFVIHAWCQWCVGSAIIMGLAFLAILPEIRLLGDSS